MHELSIAESMLSAIEDQLGGVKRLVGAQVTLGPLAGICPSALSFGFAEVADARGFGRPELTINEVPARLVCLACHEEYTAADLMELCPHCGHLERTVLSGDEFTLDSVELEEAPHE